MLRRIFRPKREEVAEGWRRLNNEKLDKLYVSPNIIRLIVDGDETDGRDEKCIQYFGWKT
jgi:hypothetical protein